MANDYIVIGGSSLGAAWGFRLVRWDGTNFTNTLTLFPSQSTYGMSWSPVANNIVVALTEIAGQYGFYLVQVDDVGGFVNSERTFLSETCYGCAFSPSGVYIAVTREASPYFTLLKWDGINLTEVTNYTLLTRGAGVSWSPDGQYIGVAGYQSKSFYLLKWDGVNLTKVAEYALPCGTFGRVFDCHFSPIGLFPDGQYIGVAFRSSSGDAGFFLLRWDEVNLTKVAEYDVDPGIGNRYGFTCRFSPDGQYIAVGHAGNSSFSLLKWDGAALTLVAQYPFVHDEWVQGVSFDETGTLIGIATDETPYFLLLRWDGVSLIFINSYNPDGKSVWSCPFHLPPPSPVGGLGPPDTLLAEQTKNPTNVRDPKPEFSAIHRVKLA